MLFKLTVTVLGHPTNLDIGRARAYVFAVGAVGGWTFFLWPIISLLSPSLLETAQYRLKFYNKGQLNSRQSTHVFEH